MNLKTSIKTGVRDVLRGTLAMRPDIYLFIAGAWGMAWLAILYGFIQHDELTNPEMVEMMTALGNFMLLVAAFPLIVGALAALGMAGLRRTRWSHHARWNHQKYVTVERHHAALESVREELRAEMGEMASSPEGGDE